MVGRCVVSFADKNAVQSLFSNGRLSCALSVDRHAVGLILSVGRSVGALPIGESAFLSVLTVGGPCRPSVKVPYSRYSRRICRSVGPSPVGKGAVQTLFSEDMSVGRSRCGIRRQKFAYSVVSAV